MFLTARKYLLRCVSLGFSLLSFALLSEAQNITGRIVANGKPLKGVVVSDGVEVTTTDGDGHYELQSGKENGYVFYSLPRGYEPAYSRGFLPRIWSPLNSKDVSADEVHDFELSRLKGSTDKYVMLFGADVHLARRNDDLKQFDGFLSALERERDKAGKRAVHTMFLGDISWDNYWTSMKFGLPELLDFLEQSRYPVPMWPVMGNHDHDPSIPGGTQTDALSAGIWRNVMGPNYYSFNLGRVHYVVLDDIVYKNEDTGGKYRKGVVGSRNYDAVLTNEQLDWLEKDLAMVKDKNAPLIIAVHIPVWKLDYMTLKTTARLKQGTSERLGDILRPFKQVHIVSGHVHVNYTARPEAYPNIIEHNIAAVCATWWRTGKLSGHHVGKDGSPGGYSRWEIDGNRIRYAYCSFDKGDSDQMRIYDMNTVAKVYREDPFFVQMMKQKTRRTDYGSLPANTVMVNVFAYDTDWKVEILEDGKPIPYERVVDEDPLQTLAMDYAKYLSDGKFVETAAGTKTYHLFRAQATTADRPITVRVTDSFGRKYEQTSQRPIPYELNSLSK